METKEVVEVTDVTKEQVNVNAPKYTDEDLNNLIKKNKIKIEEDLRSKLGVESLDKATEALKELNEIKESRKTEQEKKDEELLAVKNELTAKEQKIFELESKMKAKSLGISDDFLEDAIILAKAKTTADKDFDTALSEIVSKFQISKKEKESFGVQITETEKEIKKTPRMW